MKSAAVFLSGVAIAVAGAFTRACDAGLAAEMAASWCGDTSVFALPGHEHCTGCTLLTAGGILVAIAAVMHIARDHAAPAATPVAASR